MWQVVAVFTLLLLVLAPKHADAFWPFSTNADAAASALVPSAATPVLTAATNANPNVSAPIALAVSGDSALVSYSGPSGTMNDLASSTPSDRISVYVVRPGDTLSEIATMFDVSVNTIRWANNLGAGSGVHPGDTLIILPISGVKRTIAKGDTLKSLAAKYKGDTNEIADFNGLDPTAALVVGSTIIIPGGEVSPSATNAKPHGRKNASSREPYLGGGGAQSDYYYENPVPGALITQGIHGWNAVDLGAARGTPIRAAADGVVIIAHTGGGWNGGYGNYAVITHDNGSQTLYGHMMSAIVSAGQSVSAGQTIGYVGSTGDSTGPHLHFEVRGAANPFRSCVIGSVCSPQ